MHLIRLECSIIKEDDGWAGNLFNMTYIVSGFVHA